MTLWTASEAATATGGTPQGDWEASGVAIDGRTVSVGDLFVAVAGPNHDGHCFVGQALAGGAVAAMVSRDYNADLPTLHVMDTRAGLYALARAARMRSTARIAAITGSVGKTGCKNLLCRLLSRAGRTEASQGNLNNEWGAPLSLARLPRDAAYGVFELGMNHAGEIAPLSHLVRPHTALITAITPAHTAFFRDLEEVANAKAEIFEGLEPGGTAILNADTPHIECLEAAAKRAGAEILRFSRRAGDAVLIHASLDATGSNIAAEIRGKRCDFRLGAPGAHWALNAVGVLLALDTFGVTPDPEVLAAFHPPAGRGGRRDMGGWTLIDESYNASPAAMDAAFRVLGLTKPGPGGRRIAVLGDMLELGSDSGRAHDELAAPLEASRVDLVFAAGSGMRRLFDRLAPDRQGAHRPDAAALAPLVTDTVAPGDIVLVKGSLGVNMKAVIEALERCAGAGG
ncbi:MAG: UDP-N-acetylmuramoyl-tripeptide--D-alanyl-D-alanine ligase [Alphaproteobacteria bacterium]|nr:UDP-N-acetylmuramoyl-tripeptide--D-alanyl-D-alanine ligase [Alphaproteobacteria bacterium]MCY4318955.1 UDP-N-acetylmuramoyl-tripeptide--D-alanyl-D-alanine ligase [Alphaproteobacteria bacterium]